MPRHTKGGQPESLRIGLIDLLTNFEAELRSKDLRRKVLSLVDAYRLLHDLGSSLIPAEIAKSARDRILCYFRKYPSTIIDGEEIMVVSGISEWARRVRELRVQFGWSIISGVTAKEMLREESPLVINGVEISEMKPNQYFLASPEEDKEAARRWHVANDIRKGRGGSKDKIIEFLRQNVGQPVSGEELRYAANDKSEWARRVRELRTENGWPIVTRNTGRPDLPVGMYVLEQDRQSPEHDRNIPDFVRRTVLEQAKYRCANCKWHHNKWNRSDPRFLELHHKTPHSRGGKNEAENLIVLCNVCHDQVHKKSR